MVMPMSSIAMTAEEAFKSAPDRMFPLLDKTARLDMVDYFASGSSTPSKNKLEGKSRITALEPSSMIVEMTGSSTYQIVILGEGKNQAIMLIETIKTPAPDSKITFYDTNWGQLKKQPYKAPQLSDWLTAEGKKRSDEVKSSVAFMLVSAVFNPSVMELTLANNTSNIMPEEEYSLVAPLLKTQLVYRWDGKKMNKK